MEDIFVVRQQGGLTDDELRAALEQSLQGRNLRRVLINRRIMDPAYDLIISPGQVVPHEVVGMANHAKNLFVGVGGNGMINSSHMIGAVYGKERMMGREQAPVRKIFDYGMEHFLKDRPILFVLTVCTAIVNCSLSIVNSFPLLFSILQDAKPARFVRNGPVLCYLLYTK